MDKCQREKDGLYDWACKIENTGCNYGFAEIDKNLESYYILRKEKKYLTEYNFETLPELKSVLDELWKNKPYMHDIMKAVLVATIKNKPKEFNKCVKHNQDSYNLNELPVYTYNF